MAINNHQEFIEEIKKWVSSLENSDTKVKFIDISKTSRPRAFFTIGKAAIPFSLSFPHDYPKCENPEEQFYLISQVEILFPWIKLANEIANNNQDIRVSSFLSLIAEKFSVIFADHQQSAKLEKPLHDSLRLSEEEVQIQNQDANSSTVKLLFRLFKELHDKSNLESTIKISNEEIKYKFLLNLLDKDLFHWQISIKILTYQSSLGQDLLKYEDRYGSDELETELKFPSLFPNHPPFLRIIRPRFEYLTGNVSFGGAIYMESLTQQRWNEDIKPITIIENFLSMLISKKARVDFNSIRKYSELEANSAYSKFERLRTSGQITHVGSFSQKFAAYPPVFCDRLELETCGNVLLPKGVEQELMNTGSLTKPLFVELKSSRGLKSYAQVIQFISTPLWGIYMPYWMMESLQVEEGEPVRVQTVDFPACTFIQLRPHNNDIQKLPDPKDFLSSGLGRLSVLQQGDTVQIYDRITTKKILFDITETKPQPVVTLTSNQPVTLDILSPLKITTEQQRQIDLKENEKELKQKEEITKQKEEFMKKKREENRQKSGEDVLMESLKQTEKDKCWICGAKVRSILGINCKCGFSLCSVHRIAERHNCTFEYQSQEKLQLENKLVKVVASKLNRLE